MLLLQPDAIIMSCYTTIKLKGLRLTQQRKIILDYIHDRNDNLTAEEIINYVHGKFPRVNKSTIYRTLKLLEENNCVYKSDSMGRTIYHHAEEGHHHHLVCSNCGKTIDCEEDIFTPIEKLLQNMCGFKADFKHIVMSGLCEDCQSKIN